jgi:transposase-like protein
MLDMIRQLAKWLTCEEKVALTADLKQMIAEKLAAQAGKSATCPHCGCPEFTRCDARGSQRYLCKGYGYSLTAGTDGLLAQSKLAASQWMELTQCLAGRLTLHRCAKRCGG